MSSWLKVSCIILMAAGFLVCSWMSYMAYVNDHFPYPNGDMTAGEIEEAEAVIGTTVRFQQRVAIVGAIVCLCSAFALWVKRQPSRAK